MHEFCMINNQPYIRLHTPEQFRYSVNLSYMERSALECMFIVENGTIYKAVPYLNEPVLIEISSEDDRFLRIGFPGRTVMPQQEMCDFVIHYVREWFDLYTDLLPFYKLAERDEWLQSVVQPLYGLRIMGIPDLFEALCWGIMGQQINLTFAYTLKRRFVENFGTYAEWMDHQLWIFPSPDIIAMLSVETLMALQLTRKKSEYLIEVAARMTDGRLSKKSLLQACDYHQAEKEMVKIRGIGPWTANYVLMRCLRDPSAFPVGDVGLQNAVQHLLNMERKPSITELHELSKPWKEWAAYVTFYLWRVLY
jgi:DNA-3-methyladenine glycosylase II